MAKRKFRRIVLKLSGEALAGEQGFGINPDVVEEFAKENNISQEELEQLLSKKYDCFKCESCHAFYCYDEYSYFEEECIYCCNADSEEEEY